MSKLTKDEYLKNIQNIINESMSDEPEQLKSDKFVISRHIMSLIESGQKDPKLMDYLMHWNTLAHQNEGKEFTLYEEFGKGLSKFAKANAEVKAVLKEMQAMLNNYGDEYVIFNLIEELQNPFIQAAARDMYNNYLYEGTADARKDVIESLWPEYEKSNPVALKIIETLSDEESIRNNEISLTLNETNNYDISKELAKQQKDRRVKRTQEKIKAYAEEVFENAKQEAIKKAEEAKKQYNFGAIVNNNGIGLREAIKNIAKSDAKSNKNLMAIIEQYAGALNNGLFEERLYETFIHKLTPYNYLLPVDKAINEVNKAVKKNAVSIEITKLMEEMAESTSSYILPLIEEDCARYVKEPNPTNRVQVKNCLISFMHDPYCYKIMETIDRDDNNTINSLSEQAISIKDKIKLIKEHATITDLYSPVQYIKEGESVFYTNGQYFARKGKTIVKLGMDGIANLSEKFTTLCKLVNDPNVQIMEDHILLTTSDKVARIYEGYADINGVRETQSTLRNLQEMCMKYDYDTNFFIMASCLLENFNKIAKIDFAKHIYLNENSGLNADLFRIGDQIFINTVNEDANVSTFYHNVNPIQCKNIINSHMGINVSSLFETLLPSQQKLIMRLNETKDEYQASIDKLENQIKKLEAAKDKCNDESSIKKIDDGIKTAEDQLKELKSEYKEWLKKVAETTGEDVEDDEVDNTDTDNDEVTFDDEEVNGDGDVKKETTNEPLPDEDVEKAMDDLTTPIANGDANNEGTESEEDNDSFELSDEEFDSFLNDETNDNSEADSNDDELANNDESPIQNITAETSDEAEIEKEPEFDSNIDAEVDDLMNDETSDDVTIDSENDAVNYEEDDITVDIEPIESDDDTEGFDEVNLDDEDDINIEATDDVELADGTESEEDIIINGDEATDAFGGEVGKDVIDIMPEQMQGSEIETEEMIAKITNVMFDENIKTGVKYRTGTVNAIVPMVNKEGKMYNDNQTYTFYLDEEGNPIVDNDNMPYSLYSAIVAKIKSHPSYEMFKSNGVENTEVKTIENRPRDYQMSHSEKVQPVSTVDVKDDEFYTNNDTIEDDEDPEDFKNVSNFFDTEESDGEFSISLKDDFADIPEIDFDDDFSDDNIEDDETNAIISFDSEDDSVIDAIPVYKDGDTEIELPAPNVDGTEIPESKSAKKGKAINEHRKAIKGIGTVLNNKKGSRFFVNEDTAKSSKSLSRYGSALIREKVSGVTNNDKGLLIEDYDPEFDYQTMQAMHIFAKQYALLAYKNTGFDIQVTEIFDVINDEETIINAFTLSNVNTEKAYTIYSINDRLYCRPNDEFRQIITDFEDEVPGQTIVGLEYNYTNDKPLQHLSASSVEDWKFTIKTTINILAGEDINEHAKIRRTKLSTDHDIMNSKMVDDILHGDKDLRDFEEKVEKDTQANGIENPLAPAAPPAEESVKPLLPNVNRMSLDEAKNYEIIYEPQDKVLYKNEKAEVISISEDGKVNLKVKDKEVIAEPKDLEPDPDYVNDLEIDDSDDKKSLHNNDNKDLKDLNQKTVDCNIVVDGQRLNLGECKALLIDIINSEKGINVINEYGEMIKYDANENIEFTEWPYAVITNGEGEPLRKIKINPQSYINAGDDDYVECLCGDKECKYLKKAISILS